MRENDVCLLTKLVVVFGRQGHGHVGVVHASYAPQLVEHVGRMLHAAH